MAQINFKINGQPTTMNVDPDMPLLWALRDELGLTGTKYSCGEGLCGCCTVHLNGEAVRSCVTSVKEAEGREILTIEGLGQNGYHPLQQAWIEEEVPQCGYCQPGQIMIAAAMLEKNPQPDDLDIDREMRQALCRCGTYQRIRKAIHRAAEMEVNHE